MFFVRLWYAFALVSQSAAFYILLCFTYWTLLSIPDTCPASASPTTWLGTPITTQTSHGPWLCLMMRSTTTILSSLATDEGSRSNKLMLCCWASPCSITWMCRYYLVHLSIYSPIVKHKWTAELNRYRFHTSSIWFSIWLVNWVNFYTKSIFLLFPWAESFKCKVLFIQ